MKVLGVDYGRSKIGLALGESGFSEPWKVIKVKSFEDAVIKVKIAASDTAVDKIVVGVSENKMAEESKRFAYELNAETFDETLTSLDAQRLSREANLSRKKRKTMEDAYAASIMLQNYMDIVR